MSPFRPWPLLALLLLACDKDEPEPLQCSLGELTGTWRVVYTRKDGDCGPLPADTLAADGINKTKPSEDPCSYKLRRISSDRCRFDFDYTCPSDDAKGSARFVGVTKQTEEGKLESDMTIQLDHPDPDLVCQGTYGAVWTKL